MGCFRAIYEENDRKFKPNSNDQNGKSMIEFTFLSGHRMPFTKERALQDAF